MTYNIINMLTVLYDTKKATTYSLYINCIHNKAKIKILKTIILLYSLKYNNQNAKMFADQVYIYSMPKIMEGVTT